MKKDRLKAKVLALQNAAIFIRQHGEEGGQHQEDYDVDLDLYFAEAAKVADRLDREVEKLMDKYDLD